MATFGQTSNNAGTQTFSADRMYASRATPATGGQVTAGKARVWVSGASSPGARMLIYSDSAGEPNTLLATSDEVIVNNTAEAEKTFAFSGAQQISVVGGTAYWIAIMFDDPGTPNFTMSRANTAGVVRFKGLVYPTAPSPFAADGSSNGPLDAYIEYTEPTGTAANSARAAKLAGEAGAGSSRGAKIQGRDTVRRAQAWLYPSGGTDNGASAESGDGRVIDALKPEYYALLADGTLDQLTAGVEGFNAYSSANAADVLAHAAEAFFTVSGHTEGLVAMLGDGTHAIDSTKRSDFISTLVSFCVSIGFHGVDIDIEGYSDWDSVTTSRFVTLMDELGASLHAEGKKLSVCVPPIWNDATSVGDQWDGLDSQALYELAYEAFNGASVDYVCVMAYDYQWDWGSQKPVAPIGWIEDIVAWAKLKIEDHSRIVIGINSYGYKATDGADQYDIEQMTKAEASAVTGFGGAVRDPDSGELFFTNGGFFYSYSDSETLRLKRQAVEDLGIYKTSVWHLGGNDWFDDPAASEKAAQAHGVAAAESERGAALEGGTTALSASSVRAGEIRGAASGNSAREAELRGQDAAADARSARIQGQNLATDSRAAEAAGNAAGAAQRAAEAHGVQTIGNARSTSLAGEQAANSARAAEATGALGSQALRSAQVHGAARDNDQRESQLSGQAPASAARAAALEGANGAGGARAAELHGIATASAERPAAATGFETAHAQQDAELRGADAASEARAGRTHGQAASAAARGAALTGGAAAGDARAANAAGAEAAQSARAAQLSAAFASASRRSAQITGAARSDGPATVLTTRAEGAVLQTKFSAIRLGSAPADATVLESK
jgi:hypothetical protein